MSRTRPATRAMKRLIAAFASLLLVFGVGAITASPAYAVGDLSITVYDNSDSGNPYAFAQFTVDNGGGFVQYAFSDVDGIVSVTGLADDTYYIYPTDTHYVQTPNSFAVSGGLTSGSFSVDRIGSVIGSVPSGAGNGNTAAVIQQDVGGGVWSDLPGVWVVFEADDSFEFFLDPGPGTYRIHFQPGTDINYFDSYSDPFTAGALNTVYDLGAVSFTDAAVIEGTVLDELSNPANVTVYAYSDSASESADTDPAGFYRIKLPYADDDYYVYTFDTGYQAQWWDHSSSESGGTLVTLDAGSSYLASGIDFDLVLDAPDAYGNTLDPALEENYVNAVLYQDDGTGNFGPLPYEDGFVDSEFYFSDIEDGTYRIAFANGTDERWMPWVSLYNNGVFENSTPGNECFVEFSVVLGDPDIELSDVVVDDTRDEFYCESPPWASASAGLFTGSVLNFASMTGPIRVSLYSIDHDLLIDTSLVDMSTGGYTLSGVATTGEYYVLFEAGDSDPFLDALLGSDGGAPIQLWADHPDAWDDIVDDFGIPLTADTDSYGNDVTLEDATVFTGTVRSGARLVRGACVSAELSTDSSIYVCTESRSDGTYSLKVPINETWYLAADSYGYDVQYWEGEDDFLDAAPVGVMPAGVFAGYDFDLVGWPPLIDGGIIEEDAGPVDGIIVHLYKPVTGGYQEIATTSSSTFSFFFNFEFDDTVLGSAFPANYRVRFETPTHEWLSLDLYGVFDFDSLDDSSLTSGPSCYIDIVGVQPGPETIVVAVFDEDDHVAGTCTAEPAVSTGGGGSSGGGTAHHGGGKTPAATTPTPTPTPTETSTPEPTSSPTDEPSAGPTETPVVDAKPADLTWVLWILVVLGLLGTGSIGFFVLRRR